MPVHDWTRISAGIFHDFHSAWIIHLRDALNRGILPRGYYALAEQHASQAIADVLTLETETADAIEPGGGTNVLVAPPAVSRKAVASPGAALRLARRTLTVRHVSNHRIVALVELLSPANKDRTSSDFNQGIVVSGVVNCSPDSAEVTSPPFGATYEVTRAPVCWLDCAAGPGT